MRAKEGAMVRFLVVFLSLYSAMHVLFFIRIRILFADRKGVQAAVVLFLVFMVVAPILSRMLERAGSEGSARLLAIVGFNWTGFIFIAFCGTVLMLLADVCIWGFNHTGIMNLPLLTGKIPTLTLMGLSVLLCLYGHVESRRIKIESVSIVTEKLPLGTDRLKIVQISDVHLGLMAGDALINKITGKIQTLQPDILVSTGDLIDGADGYSAATIDRLKQIPARYGKFAVSGNHEFYAGLERSMEITRRAGFNVLRNEVETIDALINVAGVDDTAMNRPEKEYLVLSAVSNGLFTLFLKHRPQVSRKSLGLFDLQLSGHTHGGQIFPFRYAVNQQYPLPDGFVELNENSNIYTSRGTGTWGPQMRILSPPEITVIELVRKAVPAG